MKRLLIAAVMCLLVSANVLAKESEEFTSGNCKYTILDEGTVEFKLYQGADKQFEVPEEINGYKVTSIGRSAFGFANGLKSIKLPESINNITANPFMACKNVSFLISPDHPYLAIIDGALFSKPDKRLICCPDTQENYAVPDGIEIIGESAFFDCDSMKSITLPNSVTSIETAAFLNCDNLSSITLSENLTSLGNAVFSGCKGLANINLPESINNVKSNPFFECGNVNCIVSPNHAYFDVVDGVLFSKPDKRLIYCPNTKENYAVPDGIETIGDNAFSFCDGLISITLPDSVTSIGDMAFYGCENLSSITLPDSVTSIGNASFMGCRSLTNITLPNSVTNIHDTAFGACDNLTITVSRDSYAATYCEEHDLSYTYPDANDWLN